MALLMACSCSSGDVLYSEFRQVGDGWTKDRPLRFDFPDSLDAGEVDLKICVRHDNYYPYRNLWVVADCLKDGRVVESDTVDIVLADKFGNWHGSGLGRLFQRCATVRKKIPSERFDGVILWHYMRCDTVTNVSDIGVSLSLSKENN